MEKFCYECGTKLTTKELKNEGIVPFCPSCNDYRFPKYNVAVSMIVRNKSNDKVLLIEQYGKKAYILVAGYVNINENLESACIRELKEETGMSAYEVHFNRSKFFKPSNTLMCNFTVWVNDDKNLKTNEEIDSYKWFTLDEAVKNIKRHSLASWFLNNYLVDIGYYGYIEGERIALRYIKESDTEVMYKNIFSDSVLASTMLWIPSKSYEEAVLKCKRLIEFQKNKTFYVVVDKKTNEPIGQAGLKEESDGVYADAGILIARKYQNQGLGKEVLGLLLHMGFEVFGCNEFKYQSFHDNDISIKLSKAYGFEYAESENITRYDGKEFMVDTFKLTKEKYYEKE